MSASDYRPYQGFPFVNPTGTDAPTIDAATASKYDHLPRRPINPNVAAISNADVQTNTKKETDTPVVYIDIPENERDDDSHNRSGGAYQTSGQVTASTDSPIQHQPRRQNEEYQREMRDFATVYIDLPEDAATGGSPSSRNVGHRNAAFVEDTIFYDPFEDRSIQSPKLKNDEQPGASSAPAKEPLRLTMPSTSGASTSQQSQFSSSVPTFRPQETPTYNPRPLTDDGFSLTPLPVPEYSDPPPAYTEIDRRREQPSTTTVPELPRTQVVVPDIRPNSSRKFIVCPYCGQRVLTLMIRESGVFTHIMGIFCLFAFFPITFCIYCTNCCKYKNHYCPLCNNHIAYEVPVLCQKMVYNKSN